MIWQKPQNPERVAAATRPDYSLGSHVAALGVSFSAPAMGSKFADGAFVGEHAAFRDVAVRADADIEILAVRAGSEAIVARCLPAAFSAAIYCSGLRPAVSTILTPPSLIAAIYSGYGGASKVGRKVRFTPNGLLVISRQRAISLARFSGVRCVRPVMMPSPPAFETAAASSAKPT